MNVFVDKHHGALAESFRLLFEKRLGWTLLFPIGMEWFTQGFWKIGNPYPNPADTAKQYLGIDDRHWDQYKNLNGDFTIEDGIYNVYDPVHEIHQKAITLEKFKEMPIDIVISSIPAHDESFARLIREFKPNAKHIAHMGNIYQTTTVKNVMCSTVPYPTPPDQNVVFYHQEYSLDVFKYEKPLNTRKIVNFVNLHPAGDIYNQLKNALPDFEFKSYGAGCPDGTITGIKNIAKIMSESTFGFHVKPGGDGFGHILWNWAFCGRPIITNFSDYRDKLGGILLQDGKTALDLEDRDFTANINRIVYHSQPDIHKQMCDDMYNLAKQNCDFDKEEQSIRKFLTNLI